MPKRATCCITLNPPYHVVGLVKIKPTKHDVNHVSRFSSNLRNDNSVLNNLKYILNENIVVVMMKSLSFNPLNEL